MKCKEIPNKSPKLLWITRIACVVFNAGAMVSERAHPMRCSFVWEMRSATSLVQANEHWHKMLAFDFLQAQSANRADAFNYSNATVLRIPIVLIIPIIQITRKRKSLNELILMNPLINRSFMAHGSSLLPRGQISPWDDSLKKPSKNARAKNENRRPPLEGATKLRSMSWIVYQMSSVPLLHSTWISCWSSMILSTQFVRCL